MTSNKLMMFLVLLLVPVFTSAKSPDTSIIPADVQFAPEETLGKVIGTIGVRPSMTSSASVWVGGALAVPNLPILSGALVFRKIGSTDTGQIKFEYLGRGGNKVDLKDHDFKYAKFEMSLPEGHYEIIKVIGNYQQYIGGLTCIGNCTSGTGSEDEFSVPFAVKQGKVLYLGSFLAHQTLTQAGSGRIPRGDYPYYSYADKWERDKSIFTSSNFQQPERVKLDVNESSRYFIIEEDHLPEPKWNRDDLEAGMTTHQAKIRAYKASHQSNNL